MLVLVLVLVLALALVPSCLCVGRCCHCRCVVVPSGRSQFAAGVDVGVRLLRRWRWRWDKWPDAAHDDVNAVTGHDGQQSCWCDAAARQWWWWRWRFFQPAPSIGVHKSHSSGLIIVTVVVPGRSCCDHLTFLAALKNRVFGPK